MFISTKSDRLPAGWRLLFQLLLQFVLTFLLFIPLTYFQLTPLDLIETPTPVLLLIKLVESAAVLISIWAARRLLDHRSIASLGFSRSRPVIRDLLAGFLIAGASISIIYVGLYTMGWINFSGYAWHIHSKAFIWQETLTRFALFILVGVTEEMQFRGYIYNNLKDGLNRRWAVGLSSAIFALFHLANPHGAGIAPMLGLFFGGLFFVYGYLQTNALWLPIGAHIGWNFFIGPIFGFPVSGMPSKSWLIHTIQGPTIVTGGAFGPEAGLILIPALLIGSVLIYIFANKTS